MNLSAAIAKMILEGLEIDGQIELQRNELAQQFGCVPSQINYVISSRFTPEQGYMVESRRGGGGFIRISRVKLGKGALLMHVINNIGQSLDEKTCRAHLLNLKHQSIIDKNSADLMLAATSDKALKLLSDHTREETRAIIFKNLLLAVSKA
ncbi:MAG: CtsR family transcriptional regulator [Clostridiales bacterium]|nr:CtsR family transcriptional regulator [Clostridiales bacterium]